MLLAEDLMVVLVRQSSGGQARQQGAVGALAAALLIELAARGRVRVAREDSLVVVDGRPFGDDLLDEAMHHAAGTAEESVTRLAPGLYQRGLDRLVRHGQLRKATRPVTFGLLSRHVWRVTDPTYAEGLRTDLCSVLLGETPPDHRTGPIIALLSTLAGLDLVADRFPADAWDRADAIAAGGWPADPETLAVTELCLRGSPEWFQRVVNG